MLVTFSMSWFSSNSGSFVGKLNLWLVQPINLHPIILADEMFIKRWSLMRATEFSREMTNTPCDKHTWMLSVQDASVTFFLQLHLSKLILLWWNVMTYLLWKGKIWIIQHYSIMNILSIWKHTLDIYWTSWNFYLIILSFMHYRALYSYSLISIDIQSRIATLAANSEQVN